MFCRKCGNLVTEGVKFCTKCGSPIYDNGSVSAKGNETIENEHVHVVRKGAEVPVGVKVSKVAPAAFAVGGSQDNELSLPTELKNLIGKGVVRKRYPKALWMKDCPVIITECIIADKNSDGKLGLYLEVQNVSSVVVEGVFFDLKGYTVLKEEKCDVTDITCIDIRILPGKKMVLPIVVELSDPLIRKVKLVFRHIIFEDETIWNYEGDEYLETIKEDLEPIEGEYREALRLVCEENGCSGDFKWYPIDGNDYWNCGCGQFNVADKCVNCGNSKSVILKSISKNAFDSKKASLAKEEDKKRAAMEEEKRLIERQKIEDAINKKNEMAAGGEEANVMPANPVEKQSSAQTVIDMNPVAPAPIGGNVKAAAIMNGAEESANANAQMKPQFCTGCGKPLAQGMRFCTGCGKPVV